MPGLFITLEGIDGCGKTTQANLLNDWLLSEGYPVVHTRQPGGTQLGQELRSLLLDPASSIPSEAELFLYLADRSIHVAQLIKPALSAGKIVVCDRYSDSTIAYQGFGRGIDVILLKQINALATQGLMPDITIILEIPHMLNRLENKKLLDRLELVPNEFRKKAAEGFHTLAMEEPQRIIELDGGLPIDQLHLMIRETVAPRLKSISKLTKS